MSDENVPGIPGRDVQRHGVTSGGPGVVVGWQIDRDQVAPVCWTSSDGLRWDDVSGLGALQSPGGQLMNDIVNTGSELVAVGADGFVAGFNAAIWTSP